jgi:hypothetical protein
VKKILAIAVLLGGIGLLASLIKGRWGYALLFAGLAFAATLLAPAAKQR